MNRRDKKAVSKLVKNHTNLIYKSRDTIAKSFNVKSIHLDAYNTVLENAKLKHSDFDESTKVFVDNFNSNLMLVIPDAKDRIALSGAKYVPLTVIKDQMSTISIQFDNGLFNRED